MSENPNPTRCGRCSTENPPGQEFCLKCHAPLTRSADPTVLEETPKAVNELRPYETGGAERRPGTLWWRD